MELRVRIGFRGVGAPAAPRSGLSGAPVVHAPPFYVVVPPISFACIFLLFFVFAALRGSRTPFSGGLVQPRWEFW